MRKSVTNWTDRPIPREVWDIVLEAARRAPSSWNHQPARYVVITDEGMKRAIGRVLHRCNAWAVNAAGIVVQFADPRDDDEVDGKAYYLYDCGCAMMSLIHQAQRLGISARQMIGFDEFQLKRELDIPDGCRVTVVTGLGYPSSSALSGVLADAKRRVTNQHRRYAMHHLVAWQRWRREQ